jgi:hypothetical protein
MSPEGGANFFLDTAVLNRLSSKYDDKGEDERQRAAARKAQFRRKMSLSTREGRND